MTIKEEIFLLLTDCQLINLNNPNKKLIYNNILYNLKLIIKYNNIIQAILKIKKKINLTNKKQTATKFQED